VIAPEPLATLLRVAAALEQLGLNYCVGGSFASSYYGVPRSTNDVDFVVALRAEHVPVLIAALEGEFMIDPQAVSGAIAQERSFNIIDYDTLDKVDIFVMADRPWSRQQLQRRRLGTLPSASGPRNVYFASPEDVILSKLAWFRLGGEESERQWRDLLGVLVQQAGELDWPYLRLWATDLGVADLLVRAAEQAAPEGRPASE
jgi:hypothetical protein